MLDFFLWYVMVVGLGWLVFPLLFPLVPNLPDRGFSFSKIFGLLLWGYLHWIFGSLGLTANTAAGLLFCLALLLLTGVLALRGERRLELGRWLREHRTLVLASEILFLSAFAGWALVRSWNPEINGTEKPMELAFINATLYSETFPPNDPWLSGYAISYYYFGYILVAMLAKIAGTLGSVAFNLGVSLVFALSAAGSFGILVNLLAFGGKSWREQILPGLLGPLFTLIVSNWEGFLHYLYSRGWFWSGAPGQQQSLFWRWLDIQNLVDPPGGDAFGHWWWWRASRVIQDYDFSGFGKEVISEFPFFSFLLADLHPHVLSLPFVFLILAFALDLLLRPKKASFRWLKFLPLQMSVGYFLALAWLAGGMAFLNTWNFPMYVGILAGAYTLRNSRERGNWQVGEMIKDFLFLGAALGLSGIVLYLPWYASFASQAGGFIPNLLYITRGSQFWVMFGPLLIPIFLWLFYQWRRQRKDRNEKAGLYLTGVLVLGLFLLLLLVIGGLATLNLTSDGQPLLSLFLGSVGGPDLSQVMAKGLLRRITVPGTLLTLMLLSALAFSLLFRQQPTRKEADESSRPDAFVLLLILGGMVLTLFPEFLFLRDLFGYRINTIFKFYYQAWLMWSTAAAYGSILLVRSLRTAWRYPAILALALSTLMALFYPVLSIQSKTNIFSRPEGMTLDGAFVYPSSDAEGADWLRAAPFGVIAEAVGGSYSTAHARMATYSGKPDVLGWDFHEIQWRGDASLVMPRKEAVATLYCTTNWNSAQDILDQYHIRYVVVGEVEFSTYEAGADYCPGGIYPEKFQQHLVPVFQNERLVIYEVPTATDQ
jgi:YYY domain-containing protein